MVIERQAASLARQWARGFPVLALTGPRQSGKTTLAHQAFPGKPYLSLEDLETRRRAASDPRQFLAQLPEGAILDEAQHVPELFSYLLGVVDERARMGEFVLTGSQQFGLTARITQSLAGRVAGLHLLPLSWPELADAGLAAKTLEQAVWSGGYPALFDRRRDLADPTQWLAAYTASYIERDVRQLLAVTSLSLFQRFVLMCAARTGQLLNLSALATDCGISHTTAGAWLTVLEASYIVHRLPPFHQNFGKRLVKMPKLYFLDTGLLCHLLGGLGGGVVGVVSLGGVGLRMTLMLPQPPAHASYRLSARDAWRTFQALRTSALHTARAWALKETAMALARKHFARWYAWASRCRLAPMVQAAKMLTRRLENILTYLTHPITNAASESLNAKVQWVKYTARGFRNEQNFITAITAIYFHCGGLDLAP